MPIISTSNYNESIIRLADSIIENEDFNEALANLTKFSVEGILSNQEIQKLYRQKTALEIVKRWVSDRAKLNPAIISRQLNRTPRRFISNYVLEVNTPRYHSSASCLFLNQDFLNFETPPEIKILGENKVSEFQEFCKQEWNSFKHKSIDIFWAHVGAKFGVKINPKEIKFEFSGSSFAPEDMTEEEILAALKSKREEITDYASRNQITHLLKETPYKCHLQIKDQTLDEKMGTENAIIELLRMKKFIRLMVFNVYKKEIEVENGLLSEELLSALGFLPCRSCYGG